MTIIDKIENLHNYSEFESVKEFLRKNKNRILENGKYIINDECYLVVSEYNTYEPNGLFEGHLKYLDLQFIVEGEEYVHVQEKAKCELEQDYDSEKDAAFYKASIWHTLYLGKGFFAVFDADDLHRPCISVNQVNKVKKYVFKIKRKVFKC